MIDLRSYNRRIPADEVFNLRTNEGWASYHLMNVPFEGFEDIRQRSEVRNLMVDTGLPVDNVLKVSYLPNTSETDLRLGHYDRSQGEVALYKKLGKLPPIAHLDTITHEIAHTISPFSLDNTVFYGDQKEQEETISHIKAVANQSQKTKIYLNGYHALLAKSLREGKIDTARFLEETHAIMIGLRFSNPNHLNQVEQSQRNRLKALQELGMYKGSRVVGIKKGVDNTLLRLMPQMKGSVTDLDRHITQVRFNSRFGVL